MSKLNKHIIRIIILIITFNCNLGKENLIAELNLRSLKDTEKYTNFNLRQLPEHLNPLCNGGCGGQDNLVCSDSRCSCSIIKGVGWCVKA